MELYKEMMMDRSVQQMKWWQISKNSLYVRIYIVHTLAHHMHVRKDNLLPQMWIRAKLGKYIRIYVLDTTYTLCTYVGILY